MTKCINCGKEIPRDSIYCPTCGYKNIQESDLLYHYTSIETLCKIASGIQNGNFHLMASNFNKMNDPRDCTYFFQLLVNRFVEKQNRLSHINTIKKEKDKYDTPYIISLSALPDDLHMWNCYGVDGRGIAIGIERNKLYEAAEKFYGSSHIFAKLYQCKYWDQNIANNYFDKLNVAKSADIKKKDFWLGNDNNQVANLVKHPCYSSEYEYRVIIQKDKVELTFGNIYNKRIDAFFLPIPISSIKRIIVGPNGDSKSIEKIFMQYFPGTEFIQSKIPYRS